MKILKEGPGAGYSVSAAVAFRTVDDIKILDIKPEDDYATIEFSCVAHGLANELKAESYDYSVSLDDAVDCGMAGLSMEKCSSLRQARHWKDSR